MKRDVKFQNQSTGQAMIIATLFFVFISMTIVLGIVGPILRQSAIVSDLLRSRQSYFLAESGIEDVVYRLRTRLPVLAAAQPLSLGGFTATTDTTDLGGQKLLTTTADWGGRIRRVETKLTAGVGVAFNYGVHVGNGGFVLGNNAGVIGNVYSNGNIRGAQGTFITGSAFAANSVALFSDQSNLSPTPPPNWINFRDTSASQDLAQKFEVSTTSQINKVQFYIKKTGNPANATVRIVFDNNGAPSTNTLTSGTLSASLVTTNYGLVDVGFTSNPQLTIGTPYWLVIDSGSQSGSNYYTVAANDAYTLGDAFIGQYGGAWSSTTPSPLDAYFAVFFGGITATIDGDNLAVGSSASSTGDVWAHTVNEVTVYGNLYCQTGSANNKNCDTSRPDPTPQPFPISDGNINQWKAEAENGTVINGDYVLYDDAATLGPAKINGNLTVENNAHLTLSGTIWVTGNIIFTNNVLTDLLPSFGQDSAKIIADGRITISNNAQFHGSGTSGSFVMVLSTSDCPISPSCAGSYAIDVANNAGTVILNAQKGTLNFNNNSGAKEAVAYTINLSNNAVIEYEFGLANVNFTSGPSGGWDILSWKEVE